MKKFSTFICIALAAIFFLLQTNSSIAQCLAPSMNFADPVLVSGTDGAENAQYKFSSVTPGVDAFITIKEIVGGASLTSIDDNTFGYSRAWQPVVRTSTVPGVSESYINFTLEYLDSADGNKHIYNCAQISFIDVDGDNMHVRELVGSSDYSNYALSNVSTLTMTMEGSLLKAVGPIMNFAGIDTGAYVTNINFRYTNKDKINELRIGSITEPGFMDQNRYTCVYFKQILIPNVIILPVENVKLDASLTGSNVLLKWQVDHTISHVSYIIERSLNGTEFTTMAVMLDGVNAGNLKTYQAKDNISDIKSSMVYYRVKQTDINGKTTYSSVAAVRLQAEKNMEVKISPNPFSEKITMQFFSGESGSAEVMLLSITGIPVFTKKYNMVKGNNSIVVDGISSLTRGMYMARISINGKVVQNQKIIK
jgi:hypothetical protein